MTLGQKQEKFASMFTLLLSFVHSKGYGVRIKHVLRCENCPVGHKKSCHKHSLAADIYLTKDGKLLTDLDDYRFAGEFWETMDGSWGGRFYDAFHFSLEHNGVK